MVEIGNALIRQKQRLPHGMFLPWIEAEFDIVWRMHAAKRNHPPLGANIRPAGDAHMPSPLPGRLPLFLFQFLVDLLGNG